MHFKSFPSVLIQYVCVFFPFIVDIKFVGRTNRGHTGGRSQDFSSTFFLRCVPLFFSREGFSPSFPSSTVKSNFVHQRFNRSPPVGHFYFLFFKFLVRKSRLPRWNSRPSVSEGYMVSSELPGRPAQYRLSLKPRHYRKQKHTLRLAWSTKQGTLMFLPPREHPAASHGIACIANI